MSSSVPEGWLKGQLSSIATLEYGKSPNHVRQEEGQYPIVGTSGIVGTANQYLWDEKSVVIGRKGTINKPIYIETPFWAIDTTYFCKFAEDTDPKWFYYKVCEEQLEKHNEASGVPSLSRDTLRGLQFEIPPLPEQKKIASILTSVDEVIENTQKQIDKLQDLKKATMNELLTKGIGHTEFKDSELGRIPKSWEVTTLGKLARFDSGYAFKNRELAEEGIKIVRISNLHKPNFPYWHFASEYKSTWVVEKGDVLFSWAGVANSINIHRYEGERALINQHIYNFKFESEALKEWTFQVMKYLLPKLKESIEGGAGQLHLTKPFIQAIGIVLPTQSERLRILELSGSLDKQINTVERKLHQTQSLKKSLMQDLLTGKVRVTVN